MRLQRHTFTTSRLLEFTSVKELEVQTGHTAEQWPLVVLKELFDNGLDACEEADTNPDMAVTVSVSADSGGGVITVTDNGPGIPPETVASILNFDVRVSSREAYVSPTRGAQGNALKTIIAMPFALGDENAATVIESRGIRHVISLAIDAVRQTPIITHNQEPCAIRKGTLVSVQWPDSATIGRVESDGARHTAIAANGQSLGTFNSLREARRAVIAAWSARPHPWSTGGGGG